MKEDNGAVFVVFVMIVLAAGTIFCVAVAAFSSGHEAGLRDGQIKALSGQSKYVLTTQQNGETVWRESPPK